MTTASDLCARGFLAQELPPPFYSTTFGQLVSTGWNPPIPPSSVGVEHNLFRWGTLRRRLTIPNPLAFVALAKEIELQWTQLQPLLALSSWSLSTPVPGASRALERRHTHQILTSEKARVRAGNRYALRADISRFYQSIYTHTLEWAIHTKQSVKANRALPANQRAALWGRTLDSRHRDLQDKQSVGIPIGPDSSLLAAEVLLARVDAIVASTLRCDAYRYVDDYELGFPTIAHAEAGLATLQAVLADYELALNPSKTEIFELPAPTEASWTRPLRRVHVRPSLAGQRSDLVSLFDEAFDLRRREPEQHILRFVMGTTRHITCAQQNWSLLEALYLQGVAVEPGVIREVLSELVRYRLAGFQLDVNRIGYTLFYVITRHAPLGHGSEVAWALWAHVQLSIPIDANALAAVELMDDPIVALIALDAAQRGLTPRPCASAIWQALMTTGDLTGPAWLLAYEAAVKGWLPSGHIQQHHDFSAMRAAGVEFYRVIPAPQQVPIVIPQTGGGGGGGASP